MPLLAEDRALLQRFRAADRRALEQVYRHYAPQVAHFLTAGFTFQSGDRTLRFTGYHQPFDLDNALQETFLRALKEPALSSYDGLRPYKNYLFTIARNYVLDEFRRQATALRPFVEIDAVENAASLSVSAPVAESAEAGYLGKELANLTARFVERLEAPRRTYFRARFEERLTQVESAKLAGLSPMQARTQERRLREELVEYMQKSGYLEHRAGEPVEG